MPLAAVGPHISANSLTKQVMKSPVEEIQVLRMAPKTYRSSC
jgi:hypothetical protein